MDSCWNWESFAILDHNRRKAVHHIPLSTIKSHRIIQPHWQTVILHGILKYSSRIKWKWFSAWIGHFKEDLPPNNPRSPHLPLPRATQAPPATSTVQQSSHVTIAALLHKIKLWSDQFDWESLLMFFILRPLKHLQRRLLYFWITVSQSGCHDV